MVVIKNIYEISLLKINMRKKKIFKSTVQPYRHQCIVIHAIPLDPSNQSPNGTRALRREIIVLIILRPSTDYRLLSVLTYLIIANT